MRADLTISLFILALAATPVWAKTVKGPGLSTEQARPGDILPDDDSHPDAKVARQRSEANLLVPIPAAVLGGMLVLKDDFFAEHRTYSGEATGDEPDDVKNPNVAGLGVVYLPHPKEGAPRFFAIAARYGELSVFQDKARPMTEYILGADISDTDMPFPVKFNPTDQAETRVLVRLRHFPGFNRWLLLVGHQIDFASGFGLDVTIPSQVLASYEFGGGSWKVYGGVRWTGREYPFNTGGTSGWVDGFVMTRLIGMRREILGPLFVALEGGVQKESVRYVDEHGQELEVHDTTYAPWARLALETWVKNP